MKKKHPICPIYIALFMLCCLIVLAVVSFWAPEEVVVANQTIRFPQLKDILELTDTTETDSVGPDDMIVLEYLAEEKEVYPIEVHEDTICAKEEMVEKAPQKEETKEQAIEDVDTRIYLSTFYAALENPEQSRIRVIHYGDSQIEEDRLSSQLRRSLQEEYGGGGVGIIPLHQTIPTFSLVQRITMNGKEQSVKQGPQRYLAYGPRSMQRKNDRYGVMGQVAVMDNRLVAGSEDITLKVSGYGKNIYSYNYFNRVRVVSAGKIDVEVDKAIGQEDNIFILPDSTSSASIHLRGRGEIYGISLENDRGITVDNIPMRGCSGDIFTGMTAREMKQYFKDTNTKLIILQYGGNVMPYTVSKKQVDFYVNNLRIQIQYIKLLNPDCSILFVGPSDMSERRDGKMQTYKMLPAMNKALREMAIKEEIGYFSLFEAMGGTNSMVRWKEQGLAGGDYVHFTRKGADKAGKMLSNWLLMK